MKAKRQLRMAAAALVIAILGNWVLSSQRYAWRSVLAELGAGRTLSAPSGDPPAYGSIDLSADPLPDHSTDGPPVPSAQAFIQVLDVGQADASLIRLGSQTILIDTGNPQDASALVEKLDALGIRTIDWLILTHPHLDHIGGAAQVIGSIPVLQAALPRLLPQDVAELPGYLQTLDALDRAAADIVYPEAGQILLQTSEYTVRVLADGRLREQTGSLNDYSLVLRIDTPGQDALFTGDAGEAVLNWLMASDTDLNVQVLKAGHHGSRDANSLAFAWAVRPNTVLVSAGLGNEYGHPHPEVVRQYEALGARVRQTLTEGDLVVPLD